MAHLGLALLATACGGSGDGNSSDDAAPFGLRNEQQRITTELATVKGLLAAAEASVERLHEVITTAAREAENGYQAYLKAPDHERRLMNQALFSRVLVTEEGVVAWEYNEPFATLMEFLGAPTAMPPGKLPKLPPTLARPPRVRPTPEDATGATNGSAPAGGPGRWVLLPSVRVRNRRTWRRGWDLNPR